MGFDLGLGNLLGGIVSGIGSIVGSSIGSSKGLQAVRESNQANRELAEYAYEKDLEMWNRQNVYNSPSAQMERLKQAGLNPHLMYGQGNIGNASSMPSYDAPNIQAYTDFGDFGASRAGQELMQGIQGYANIKKTEAEAENIRQNTANMEAQRNLLDLQIIQQGILNAKGEIERDNWFDLYRSKIAANDSTALNNFAHAELADSQRHYTDAQRQRFEVLTPLVEQSVQAELSQKLFDLNYISPAKLQNLYSDSRYKNIISKVADAKASILFNDLEFSNEQKKYYSEKAINEILLQRSNVEIKQLEKDLTKLLKEKGIKPGMSVQQAIVALFAMPWFE